MRLSSLLICFAALLSFIPHTHAQTAQGPTAELITIGPGEEVWEKYGHNMLRIRVPDRGGDASKELDISYNWGLFDFNQPNFIGNFVLGRMTYTMDGDLTAAWLEDYRVHNRHITRQQLNLRPEQVIILLRLCEENRKPPNKDYTYDYFRDNCATRVRDMINQGTGGELKRLAEAQQAAHPGMSYRQHALRLMQDDWLLATGIDLALGPATDVPLSTWDACFVPMEMLPVVAQMSTEQPAPWKSTRPKEPDNVPRRWPLLTTIGVACAFALAALAKSKWRKFAIASLSLWWVLSTIAAGFMLFVWCFTDHWCAYRNQNLLHFSPIALPALIALAAMRRRPTWLKWPAVAIVAIAIVAAVLKLVGLLSQDNAAFIGLSLPLNLAAVYVAVRLTPAGPVDEVAVTPS